jgi:hypothetical protein
MKEKYTYSNINKKSNKFRLIIILTIFSLNKIYGAFSNIIINNIKEKENNNNNYTILDFINNNPSFLILFTVTNSLKSDKYIKILIELSQRFPKFKNKLNEINIDTINSIENPLLVEAYNIKESPSFLFFYKKFNIQKIIYNIESADELQSILENFIRKAWKFLDDEIFLIKNMPKEFINFIICKDSSNIKHESIYKIINKKIENFDINLFYADHYLYEKFTKGKKKLN